MQPHPAPVFVVCAALVAFAGACASPGGPPIPTAPVTAPVDPLAGCRLQAGPAALCDDGRVILDVATAPGAAAERLVVIHGTTDRPDAPFLLEPGATRTTDGGDVVRVDVVRPRRTPAAAVGTVTFLAPATGQAVVSCASFADPVSARCLERARALLAARVPETASIQHRPTVALPPDPDCTGTDATFAQQRLCSGDVKLSIVGIRGRFGPAAAWWTWHRIVQSQTPAFRLVTTCPVLGAIGPCAVVDLGDKVGLFGAHVARDELQIAACFAPPSDAVPRSCLAAFGQGPTAVTERHIGAFDLPLVGGCRLAQASSDVWSRRIDCDDGTTIAQFADASEAASWIATRTTASSTTARCVVAGIGVPCTKASGDGVTVWRAEVKGPVVETLVCAARSPTPPPLCASFIEVAP